MELVLRRNHERTERDQVSETEETIGVAVSAAAAVATAWSAFQSSTWSGVQTFHLAEANRLRQRESQEWLEGDQQLHLDADLFVSFVGAYVDHHEAFATFLRDRFPARLRKATDAWLATKPLESDAAPPHPFAMKEYVLEARERSVATGRAADEEMHLAAKANHTSDMYFLSTVILATIILFASLGPRLRARPVRRVAISFGGAALLAVIVWLALRPVSWAGVSL